MNSTFDEALERLRGTGSEIAGVPVLAVGGPAYRWMKKVIPPRASSVTTLHVENTGHFLQEERPDLIAMTIRDFLQGEPSATPGD